MARKPDYHIEFAHIYADEEIGIEQRKSLGILKKVISKLRKRKKSFVVSILIDDFHSAIFRLNEKKMIEIFKKQGIDVDFMGYESKLRKVSDRIIREIPKNLLKLEHFHHPDKSVLILNEDGKRIGLREDLKFVNRPTCAILSASWTLCRLGLYELPKNSVKSISNKQFKADKVITILPEKYHPVEDKVMDIIKSTRFKDKVKDIEYEFFEI